MSKLNYNVQTEVKDNFTKGAEYQIYTAQVNIVRLEILIKAADTKKEEADLKLQILALKKTMANNISILEAAKQMEVARSKKLMAEAMKVSNVSKN